MGNLKMQVLVDDHINNQEHGLSIYIEANNKRLLFDIGQTNQYLLTMKKFSINEKTLDFLIISHGHYDHANGLAYFNYSIPIYIHNDALIPKYKKLEEGYYFNGINQDSIDLHKRDFVLIKQDTEITPNIFVLADIKTKSRNKNFLVGEREIVVDDFHDEIFLVVAEDSNLSLFFGCSHFGIVEGLKKVKKTFPNNKIKNVIAGMHLLNSSREEIIEIIDQFKFYGVANVYPLHCTGELATSLFMEEYGENCIVISSSEVTHL